MTNTAPKWLSLGRIWPIAAALFGVAWLSSLVTFVRSRAVIEVTLPERGLPPDGEFDVAAMDCGPKLRASSYEPAGHHHPSYVVDQQKHPSGTEKWASSPKDRAPWIELGWPTPRDVSRVVITFAGALESPSYNVRKYKITCLLAAEAGEVVSVEANTESIANHAIACPRSSGIRVDFTPNDDKDIVRVYEIEAFGQ